MTRTKIDSGILQYVPKGAYYEGADEQFQAVSHMWEELFHHDRTLFALTTLLGGTGFSKGAMSHMLLKNRPVDSGNLPVVLGSNFDYEPKIILHNLRKEKLSRALKNLLMLTGEEGFTRVNNARTRKVILNFIFNRNERELDSMAINFKGKMKKLVRHALGKQDIFKITKKNDLKLFNRWIGCYNSHALPVVCHLFDVMPTLEGVSRYYPKIDQYWRLRKHAQDGNLTGFRKTMKGMPQRTVIGFRNTYKLEIELSEIYDTATVSKAESIQVETAAKRSGSRTFKVNYKSQGLYALWKAYYHKVLSFDNDNIDEIEEAIAYQSERQSRVDIGDCVIVIDASHSMFGSDERKLHPFLTSLCLVSSIDNVKDVFYIGGNVYKSQSKSQQNVLVPCNGTPLWKGFVDAVETGVENIVIISDGYENEVKGMFKHAYDHFAHAGRKLNILHLNPVFAADAQTGTARRLAEDIDPIPLADYRFLETEVIFQKMISDSEMVKQLLIQKFQNLLT